MTVDPELLLAQKLASQPGERGVVSVDFSCRHDGLDGEPESLTAFYDWQVGRNGPEVMRFLVTNQRLAEAARADTDLAQLSLQLDVPLFDLSRPAILQPVSIPKPWGQEIWYTGMEARGVSQVGDGRRSIPLPWYLAAAGKAVMGHRSSLNLLKILDPLPEPVLGDLYFELHEQKQEVYVVTAIDPNSWPNGKGAIRLGFSADARARYSGDEAFRAAYLDAVECYREIRVRIDELIDGMRRKEGVGLDVPVSAETQRRWMSVIPAWLREEEARRRVAMEDFARLWPLAVGEVVQVPLRTPHALQHGVRTVEFQTPVYERKILSFGQKVLTQSSWDTREAVEMMALDVPALSNPELLGTDKGWRLERIVAFDDFSVERLQLQASARWLLETEGDYALLMVVGADIRLGDSLLEHEQACIISAVQPSILCQNATASLATLLICRPR